MFLSLYALLLRTLVIDLHDLHAKCKKSAQYLRGYRKKVWKMVPSVKFTKSKASNSAKNQ